MTTHVLTMRDGSEYRLSYAQASAVTAAIAAGKNFYLGDDYLNCHEVKSVKRVVSSAEGPVMRLDAPKEEMRHVTKRGEAIKAEIRAKLANVDPYQDKVNAYMVAVEEDRRKKQAVTPPHDPEH